MTDYSVLPALVDERLAGGRVTIDLGAIVDNWKKLDDMAPGSKTAAVVKADAYGLGVEPVAKALYAAGCRWFFVALPEEGVRVRKALREAEIFVLGGLFKDAAPTYAEAGLIPILGSIPDLERWAGYWRNRSTRRPCAIHVDTAMNRLGLTLEETRIFVTDDATKHSVTPVLLMSHLACGDEIDDNRNIEQLKQFRKAMALFPETDYSLANSAGVIAHEKTHFDLNRPGIALYGGEAVNGMANPMSPAVTLEGRIVQVRTARKGETIGYGGTHKLARDSRIAIVAVGYADGYHRANSGNGVPLRRTKGLEKGAGGWLSGYAVPIIGRVSMDLTAFDVTDVPDQLLEDAAWIELFGKNIALDDVARACGTIGYELLTSLGPRYSRSYLGA